MNHNRHSLCNVYNACLGIALIVAAHHTLALDTAALPTGGQVTVGSGNIVQSGAAMTVSQASQNLAINWQSFNIGAAATVNFVQPNSSAIVLNRVIGGGKSEIYGRLNANGQVFLLNPNGVLFGKNAEVNVGGLVATTLGLSDADFMNRNFRFTGTAGNVDNEGSLSGKYVALLGGQVSNRGSIVARLGSVALAAGSDIALDFAGDGLIGVQVRQGALDALAENKQLIRADGGNVLLTARAADKLIQAVVNNEGVIEARTVENKGGVIKLLGDMENGLVKVAGTLDASAPMTGNGGFVETSAEKVGVGETARVSTLAANGKAGTWLIDPVDYTIAASGGNISGATLSANLGLGNVAILSSSGTVGGNGDIHVNDAVSWSANNLTLTAARDININAVMTASGSSSLTMNTGTANGADAGVAGGAVKVGFAPGYNGANRRAFAGRVDFPGRSGTGLLTINGQGYTVVQNRAQLEAINGNLAGHYALGGDVDLSFNDWAPLGSMATPFTGVFTGLGHVVWNLTISSAGDFHGLFGFNQGTLENVQTYMDFSWHYSMIGGGSYIGTLAGANDNSGIIRNVVAMFDGGVSIVGSGQGVGGLVGANAGTIVNAHVVSSGNTGGGAMINGDGSVGGLVGYNGGAVYNSSASNFSIGGYGLNPSGGFGGLVGINDGAIAGSYASGWVVPNRTQWVGGLVGIMSYGGASIADSYATGTVGSATVGWSDSVVGGLVGYMNPGTSVTNSYTTATVAGASAVGGLVGQRYSSSHATVTNSFWDTANYATSDGGDGKTATELTQASTFAGWSLSSTGGSSAVWRIYEGQAAPLLRGFLTPLTVTANSGARTYDGNVAAGLGVTYSATPNADLLGSASVAAAGASRNVGSYTLTPSGLYSNQMGYDVSYANGALNITPASLTISTSAAGKIYNGTTSAPGTAIMTGGTLYGSDNFSGGTFAFTDKNAGTNKTVTVSGVTVNDGNGGGNYTVTYVDNTASIIVPASLTISTSAAGKTYDGTTNAPGTAIMTGGTLYGSDNFSGGTFAFTDKNAGTNKTVTVSGVTVNDGNGGGNYTVTYVDNTASIIAPASLTISTSNVSKTYDGTTSAAGTAIASGGTQLFSTDSLSGGSFAFTGKNAGTNKTVTVSGVTVNDGNGGGNYTVSYADNTASTINRAGLTVSTTDVTRTYDGTTSAAGTAIASGGTQLFSTDSLSGGSFAFTDKNAGTNKTVTVSSVTVNDGNGGGNYTVTYADNATSTIGKFGLTLTGGSAGNKVYDGTTVAAVEGALSGVIGSDSVSLTGSFDTRNVGVGKTVTLGLGGIDGGNYSLAATATANITPASLVLGTGNVSKTYDGTTAAAGAAVVAGGTLFAGDTLSGGTFAFADKNVGEGNKTVTVSGIAVNDGNGGNNYSVSYADNTASTITAARLAVTGVTAVDKVYDGTTAVALGGSASVTALGSDVLTLGGTGSGVFADKHVSGGKAVIVSGYTLGGSDAGNYNLVQPTGVTANITPASLVLGTGNVSKAYDGTTAAAGAAVVAGGTLFAGDTLSGGTFAFADKNVGEGNKTVTVSGVTVNDGNGGNNYSVGYADNTHSTITAARLMLSTGDVSKTYDGTTAAAGAAVVAGGTLFAGDTLGGGIFAFADKNVGEGNKTVTVSGVTVNDGNGGNNYSVGYADNTHSTITPASLTLTGGSASNKTYDGNTAATVGGVLTGVFGSDSLSFSGVFDTQYAGAGKTVTFSLSGADAGNYTLAGATTANIAPALLTVTANDAAKTYDGRPWSGGNGVRYSGFVSGEDASVLAGALAYGGNAQGAVVAGEYAIVPYGLTAGNYVIDFVGGRLSIARRNTDNAGYQAALAAVLGVSHGVATGGGIGGTPGFTAVMQHIEPPWIMVGAGIRLPDGL